MDSISRAQGDMRKAYVLGIPGVIASGAAWVIAGLVALFITPINGIFTLIFGGTLIFPVSVLLCKAMGASGRHQKGNPLGPLAIEGTFWMLLSIPVACAAAAFRLEWFFPAMMLVIGGRYLTFATLYGMKIYWVFAAALVLGGVATGLLYAPAYAGALTGGLIEWAFASIIFLHSKKALPTPAAKV